MGVKHRYIDRRDWRRPTARRSGALLLPDGAWAHRLDLVRVTEPAWGSTCAGEGRYIIADEGWCWLSWMRRDRPWALTAMRDTRGEWVQWYFDVVSDMGCDADGRAWFEDCYLDVAVLPDGQAYLLDADEMEAALRAGEVTPAQYEAAWAAARALMARFPGDLPGLRARTQALWERFAREEPFLGGAK